MQYGEAIEIQKICYDTASHLLNQGILDSNDERHKKIIDWAVSRASKLNCCLNNDSLTSL